MRVRFWDKKNSKIHDVEAVISFSTTKTAGRNYWLLFTTETVVELPCAQYELCSACILQNA